MSDMRALISRADAAKLLNMSLRTLREHVKDGTLPVIVTGRGLKRRHYAFDPDDLETFRKSRREYLGPPPAPPTTRNSRRAARAVPRVFDFDALLAERLEQEREQRRAAKATSGSQTFDFEARLAEWKDHQRQKRER